MSSSIIILIKGYNSNNYWDDFNMSTDRIHEMEQIKLLFQKNILTHENITSFSNIQNKTNKKNILIIGELTYGTGNLITGKRLKKIISELGYNTFIYNVKYINESKDLDEIKYIEKLENFLIKKQIHLIFGIHIWRSGKVLNFLYSRKKLKIPYCLIVSGTDANVFIYVFNFYIG